VDIPELFLYYKNEIKGILWYLHNSFLKKIKFIKLLNEHANNLYDYNNELQILQFYKFLIQQQGIQRYDLMQYFPKKNYRKEFVQRMDELKLADTGNANSMFELISAGVFGQLSIPTLIEKSFGEKVEANDTTVNREEILSILKENENDKLLKDEKVIKELSQEIIDELELTLFNVKTIKNKNLVLYIFIDKNNLKRYYYEPFEYTFFVSINPNIIFNDYLANYDSNLHIAYTFTNFEMVNKFKFLLNDVYKKHMIQYLK
jgi:dephospho-CoA kinase